MMAQKKRKELSFRTPSPDSQNVNKRPRHEDVNLKHEFDTPKRVRVKTLFEAGWTRKAIEQREGVAPRTQRYWQQQGDRRTGKDRPGRPKIITKRTLCLLVRYVSLTFENR